MFGQAPPASAGTFQSFRRQHDWPSDIDLPSPPMLKGVTFTLP